MGFSFLPSFILSLLLFSLEPTSYATKQARPFAGAHSHGSDPSLTDLEHAETSHYNLLGSLLGNNEKARDAIFYSYTRHINGFAAFLEEEEAAELAKHPDIVSVFLNKGRKLCTTHSWDFLGLEKNGEIPEESIWKKARFGEDTIIGSIDTGIWPESKSFGDEGIGSLPSNWRGICQQDTKGVHCNRKLIGVRYFNKGYAAYAGALDSSFYTARDSDGHGTHTLSTAAGNFVLNVSVFGNGHGNAKGGSPKARVSAYKVCWPPISGMGCFDADLLAAFEAAISDGVHVISVSLGDDPLEFFHDALAIGALHAAEKGILVVTAAGNSGPYHGTVTNVAPWMLTVGASSTDREFTNLVALGTRKHLKGVSLSARGLKSNKFYPLISAADAKVKNASNADALSCKAGALDPKKVRGNLLVCLWKDYERTKESMQAALAGAVGVILANDERNANDVVADTHELPTSHLNFTDGKVVFDYIMSTKTPMAYMTRPKTEFGRKPAPIMTQFSSRGPSRIEPAILKPDVIAPGLSIIAAYTEETGPTNDEHDKRRIPYNVQTGTSMSCPHVSGIAGLIKTIHPHWSPAAIKSAIMTTATSEYENMESMQDANHIEATPFAYGAGHIQPNRAMDPGLIYDLTFDDYMNFLCARGYNRTILKFVSDKSYKCLQSVRLADFNYPSITIPDLSADSVTVTRKVTNVGSPGTYKVHVKPPAGVVVSVKPKRLRFSKIGEKKMFKVNFQPKVKDKPDDYTYGELLWTDGKHYVKSPLVVKRK